MNVRLIPHTLLVVTAMAFLGSCATTNPVTIRQDRPESRQWGDPYPEGENDAGTAYSKYDLMRAVF